MSRPLVLGRTWLDKPMLIRNITAHAKVYLYNYVYNKYDVRQMPPFPYDENSRGITITQTAHYSYGKILTLFHNRQQKLMGRKLGLSNSN